LAVGQDSQTAKRLATQINPINPINPITWQGYDRPRLLWLTTPTRKPPDTIAIRIPLMVKASKIMLVPPNKKDKKTRPKMHPKGRCRHRNAAVDHLAALGE
jgi:hypothetical protein